MKLFNGIRAMLGSALMAASLMVGLSAATPASAQVVVVQQQPYYGPGCPVPAYQLQDVLSGMYGVDGLQRPLSAQGFPVDVNGNCLTGAPVTEVFNYSPAQIYLDILLSRYAYHYYYRPGFVHLYGGPGVMVYRNYGGIPYGHTNVIIQRNYGGGYYRGGGYGRVPNVVVQPGRQYNVRPGGGIAPPPVSVRPGAGFAPPPARYTPPPAVVTPPRSYAPTTTFNRSPGGFQRPTSVTPPRSMGGPSVFRRR